LSNRPENINQNTGVAFLFPGQGSQSVGMGLDLYKNSPVARAVFEEVDDSLGVPLSDLLFNGPEEELTKTVNAQPAIMAVSIACLRGLEDAMGEGTMPVPSLVAGHSLGEYTALVAAGALSLADGVRLVRERGRLMQYAAELRDGGMAAILSLDHDVLESVCLQTDTEISNINAPDQIVISGERQSVEKAMELATEKGARRTVALAVAGAFHSRLMAPAQEGLEKIVNEISFSQPSVPLVANCTGQAISDVDDIKAELLAQLCSCVRWSQSVDYMARSGINSFYEIGPGRVISGMVKRNIPDADVTSVSDSESIKQVAS